MRRYIALSDRAVSMTGTQHGLPISKLKAHGLEVELRVQSFTVLMTKQMPFLLMPGGALLLGEAYDTDGRRVADPTCFRHIRAHSELRRHLLAHYWGEYLLIQPGEDGAEQATTFLRDPSGGLGCAHSSAYGFVTSDVSLASELGLYPGSVDWSFIQHCLAYSHLKIPRTGFSDVHELLPGCLLEIMPGTSRTSIAWSPWHFVSNAGRFDNPALAGHAVRSAVMTVVRAMARTDESLLLQLSGGLDSSIIGMCLKDADARLSACNAISSLPGADERHYAEQVTDKLGIKLQRATLDLSQPGIQFTLPPDTLRPAVSPLAYAAGCAMDTTAHREHVNAIYSGGGGDTVFGYLKTAAPAADAWLAGGLTAGWKCTVDLTKLHGCTLIEAMQLTLRKLVRPPKPAYKQDASLLRTPLLAPLESHPWLDAQAGALPGDRERIFELAGNQLFREVMLRGDGRRVRMPLLAQPVMEACLRVPSWMWIAGGHNRAIARAAFSDLLPAEILNRRSKGSFMNYNAAIYRRHKENMRRFLLDGRLNGQGLLDPAQLNAHMDRPLGPRDMSFLRIFDLCMVENWVRQHG